MSAQQSAKWLKVKELMKEGLSERVAGYMDRVLDNTLTLTETQIKSRNPMLLENASDGVGSTGSIAALNQVVLPILRS